MICSFHVESAVCKLRNLLPRLGRKFETLTCFFQYSVCCAFIFYHTFIQIIINNMIIIIIIVNNNNNNLFDLLKYLPDYYSFVLTRIS